MKTTITPTMTTHEATTFSPEVIVPVNVKMTKATRKPKRLSYEDRVRLAANHQPPQRWYDEDVTGLQGPNT